MLPATLTKKLNDPSHLTKEIHTFILDNLRNVLDKFVSETPNENLKSVKIRNWLFLKEDGDSIVDIILDKGYVLGDIGNKVAHTSAQSNLSLEECVEVHQFLLDTNALDLIADDVSIRVGSPGIEPVLFNIEDFIASLGDMVEFETWESFQGQCKFKMLLSSTYDDKENGTKIVVFMSNKEKFEFPLNSIKMALALPFHPDSKSAAIARKIARKKAQDGARKKYNIK